MNNLEPIPETFSVSLETRWNDRRTTQCTGPRLALLAPAGDRERSAATEPRLRLQGHGAAVSDRLPVRVVL